MSVRRVVRVVSFVACPFMLQLIRWSREYRILNFRNSLLSIVRTRPSPVGNSLYPSELTIHFIIQSYQQFRKPLFWKILLLGKINKKWDNYGRLSSSWASRLTLTLFYTELKLLINVLQNCMYCTIYNYVIYDKHTCTYLIYIARYIP